MSAIAKAFLSHSSKDKDFVDAVCTELNPATYELDSETFDYGLMNAEVIATALDRSGLYVLFLSNESAKSPAVRLEALLNNENILKGKIHRVLIICLDDDAFALAETILKVFNFVRRTPSPQTAARIIQSAQLEERNRKNQTSFPFVGRSTLLDKLKTTLSAPDAAPKAAIYVSGPPGIGRRTLAKKIYADVYPHALKVPAVLPVSRFDGLDEIHRNVLRISNPNRSRRAFLTHITGFAIQSEDDKAKTIGDLINATAQNRDVVHVLDEGGLLDDSGQFSDAWRKIFPHLHSRPHPSVVFVAERMMPARFQSHYKNMALASVESLEDSDTKQLVGLLLQSNGLNFDGAAVEEFVRICDGHPFNAAFAVDTASKIGIDLFLKDTQTFLQWKKERASAFLSKVSLDANDICILWALKMFGALNLETLAKISPSGLYSSIVSLMDFHILESRDDDYFIAKALRIAVEKDPRVEVDGFSARRILDIVANSFKVDDASSPASPSMIDAAIVAQLAQNKILPEQLAAFMLPSHQLWLARRRYDAHAYEQSVTLALDAIKGWGRLSLQGKVEACRILALGATRLRKRAEFDTAVSKLRSLPGDSYAQSNLNFLLGFEARFAGKLPEAEAYFRTALDLAKGNHAAARELANVCLLRGDEEGAEKYARGALPIAPDNAFILDIMTSVLLRKLAKNKNSNQQELDQMFDRLERVSQVDDRSFYSTRKAEYELIMGRKAEARKLIDDAERSTPKIFNVHLIKSRIYLDSGIFNEVARQIGIMSDILQSDRRSDGRTFARSLTEIEIDYLSAVRQFNEAKEKARTSQFFTDDERARLIRSVEIEQGYSRK